MPPVTTGPLLSTVATMRNRGNPKPAPIQTVSSASAPGADAVSPHDATPTIPVGTVSVQRTHPYRHQAVCTCGQLTIRRRMLRGFAVGDALHHAAQTGCAPAQPLAIPRLTTT